MSDRPSTPPTAKLLQFGPFVSGYRFVYAKRKSEDVDDVFVLETATIDAFGLAELYYPDTQVMRVEPVALWLHDGVWKVAQERPGFCGIMRTGQAPADAIADIDPYYEERLEQAGGDDDG